MKIIAIDTESTVGMLCLINNQTIMWEFDMLTNLKSVF